MFFSFFDDEYVGDQLMLSAPRGISVEQAPPFPMENDIFPESASIPLLQSSLLVESFREADGRASPQEPRVSLPLWIAIQSQTKKFAPYQQSEWHARIRHEQSEGTTKLEYEKRPRFNQDSANRFAQHGSNPEGKGTIKFRYEKQIHFLCTVGMECLI